MFRINHMDQFGKGGMPVALPYSRTVAGILPWYSVLVVSGIVLAIWLASCEEKRKGLPADTVVDLALMVIPFGIAGARLYYVLMRWEYFAPDPLSILYVWKGGLAIYGGVLGGMAGAWIYARVKKLSMAALVDIVAPGLLLAQAVGRWGNYFNMEAYGPVITQPALQFFPFGVLIPDGAGYSWHMATFFYESMWNLAGFCVLWRLRKRISRTGSLFCWYLLIYGSGRFVIEQLRTDSLYLGAFRVSQYLSLLLCVVSSVILLLRSSAQRSSRYAAAICAALWIARWGFVGEPALYGMLMFAAGIIAIWLLRNQKNLWLLAGMLMLDAGGLLIGMSGWLLANEAHALICSVTLPGLMMALCVKTE